MPLLRPVFMSSKTEHRIWRRTHTLGVNTIYMDEMECPEQGLEEGPTSKVEALERMVSKAIQPNENELEHVRVGGDWWRIIAATLAMARSVDDRSTPGRTTRKRDHSQKVTEAGLTEAKTFHFTAFRGDSLVENVAQNTLLLLGKAISPLFEPSCETNQFFAGELRILGHVLLPRTSRG